MKFDCEKISFIFKSSVHFCYCKFRQEEPFAFDPHNPSIRSLFSLESIEIGSVHREQGFRYIEQLLEQIIQMRSSSSNEGVSTSFKIGILIMGSFLVALIVFMNIYIDEALFIRGINFIYDYQTAQPYGIIHFIQNLFSLFCNPIGVGAVLLTYYILVNRKLLLIVHLSYFLFSTYIIAILKQAFQQSRPIWYDQRIQNWEWFCPKDFGNPSGHSFAVMLLYEPIISDSIGYGKHRLWIFPLLVFGVMVPVSRMYLGVHSANQILFGLSLGFVFLILYKYIYQKALYELFWELLLGPTKCIKIFGIIILHIITYVIPIIFYLVNIDQRPMNEKDVANLNQQCGTNLTGHQVQIHILAACAIGSFAFGLIYGFMLLANHSGYKKYLLGLWIHESCTKVIIKLGLYILCAFVPACLFFGLGKFVFKDAIVAYTLNCIGAVFLGLGLSYFAPIMTSKCQIMKLLPGQAEEYVDQIKK